MACRGCSERRRRLDEAARKRDMAGVAVNLALGAMEMIGLKKKLDVPARYQNLSKYQVERIRNLCADCPDCEGCEDFHENV